MNGVPQAAAPDAGIHRHPPRWRIPLSRPDISCDDIEAVLAVLKTGQLSLGPFVERFETAFASTLGVRHAIAVNSGTSGLHLCIKAAGIRPGDEVITSPFSFVASANCILYEQAVPVFVDVDPSTYNLDPTRIEAAITSKTRALLPVHVFGRPCSMQQIMDIASRHGLSVIEDACEAVGAKVGGHFAGTFGQTGVFAFYPNKQITTGEGGMIVTNEPNLASMCRAWRNQGRLPSDEWLQHELLGYNYRLSDLHSALGLAQLSRLPAILTSRAQVAALYTKVLSQAVPELVLPDPAEPGTEISWFVYVVRLRDDFTLEQRNWILRFLRQHGIGCSNYFTPIHLQPYFRQRFGWKRGDFPVTESISDRTIALPFHNALQPAEVELVCDTLRQAFTYLPARRCVSTASTARSAHGASIS